VKKITLTLEADELRLSPRALMSEKFDGIQARWDGRALTTRSGRQINPPSDLLAELPPCPLAGELWMGRGTFQECQSVVLRVEPDARRWRDVRLMVFEGGQGLRNSRRVRLVDQLPARNVRAFAEEIISEGGEGAVVRDGGYFYKVKALHDAEARVVGYEPGTGRLQGMVGAFVVEEQGATFKIGAGIPDDLRRQPPPLGAVVTFGFEGRTKGGAPRFPRFMRERRDA
jgi:DNA ligase-1